VHRIAEITDRPHFYPNQPRQALDFIGSALVYRRSKFPRMVACTSNAEQFVLLSATQSTMG
jgi:hypothetical protein